MLLNEVFKRKDHQKSCSIIRSHEYLWKELGNHIARAAWLLTPVEVTRMLSASPMGSLGWTAMWWKVIMQMKNKFPKLDKNIK